MSQRHPGSRRTRHEASDEPDDVFVARVLDVGNWAQAHQQLLTVVAIVVAIAIASVMYYGKYRSQLHGQAAEQLETIYQSIAIQDIEGAKADLATFLDRFDGTPYEGEARLILGELYLNSGDPQ
jgi:predicted negative regulator of RcsB-dependent stress response